MAIPKNVIKSIQFIKNEIKIKNKKIMYIIKSLIIYIFKLKPTTED